MATTDATITSDGIVVRYRAPDPALAALVVDYGFYDSGAAGARVRVNDYLPGLANVCLTFGAGPVAARIRNREHRWTDDGVVFGPSSHLMRVESNGGRLIGFGVTPLGWARLFGNQASRIANNVVPLATLWTRQRACALHDALADAPHEDAAVAVLDRILVDALQPAPRDAAQIEALTIAVQQASARDCTDIAEDLGLSPAQLRRIAKQYAGFGPKLLLRRARFVQTAMAVMNEPAGGEGIALPHYYDHSHFIRDAQLFLGKTARQFSGSLSPLMAGMLRGRDAHFGTPLQSLIWPGRDNAAPPERKETPIA